jgi:glycosylphosphatidylinositol transamidase (GPIT) subunit GPI8
MSGHGGDEFFKFQDHEELSAEDIGFMFHEMYIKKLYKEIIFIIDTCQATTLANYIISPNIITIASSKKGENSYSYVNSEFMGVSLIDRFSFTIQQFFNQYRVFDTTKEIKTGTKITNRITRHSYYNVPNTITFQDLMDFMDPRFLRSTATVTYSPAGSRHTRDIPLAHFFGLARDSDSASAGDTDKDSIELIDVLEC